MALQTNTLTIRGKKIQLLRGGSGKPLLYLHGLAADIHSLPATAGFTAFHDALAASFSLSAPALPGYADSEGFDDLETIEDAVFFCLDVLDALKLDQVNLVGASLGGWVATEFATRYSHRLHKLVLIDPLGVSTPQARIGNFFYAVTPKAEGGQHEARELLFSDPNSELAMGAVPDQMPPDAYMLFYKAQLVGARLGWRPPYLYNPRLQDRLFRIQVPTLVVWAGEDKLAPPALAGVFKGGIAGAEGAVVPGAAHALLLEQPQRTAELVSQFLNR
ncbi:MAG TPA: alpha/beta hydrolase [Candidatus Binatia bacterium]|nr:alpha/beta hydrolase [Candidatus Binatia bacterium]